jgi:hypothetical protein
MLTARVTLEPAVSLDNRRLSGVSVKQSCCCVLTGFDQPRLTPATKENQ